MRHFFELILISILIAVIVAITSPVEIEESQLGERITLEDFSTAIDSGNVLIVDARSQGAYDSGHIPGAISLTEDDWESGLLAFLEIWSPGMLVVVYCDSDACTSSEQVASRIETELQIDDIRTLEGGWETWQSSTQSIEPKP